MRVFEVLEAYFFKNKKLIFFILEELKQCIPKEDWDAYYEQINCIQKIQWVLDKEVDLYYNSNCPHKKIFDQEKIATVIIDTKDITYKIYIFSINGKIFSFESNLPFRNILIQDINNLEIQCQNKR